MGNSSSTSNDSSNILAEIRQALLLARLNTAVSPKEEDINQIFSARKALELATLGGAKILGRNDIGSLEPGKCADCISIRLDRVEYSGALHDPVAATVLCAPVKVDNCFIHGQSIVENGHLTTLDLEKLIESHNKAAFNLVDRNQ